MWTKLVSHFNIYCLHYIFKNPDDITLRRPQILQRAMIHQSYEQLVTSKQQFLFIV